MKRKIKDIAIHPAMCPESLIELLEAKRLIKQEFDIEILVCSKNVMDTLHLFSARSLRGDLSEKINNINRILEQSK